MEGGGDYLLYLEYEGGAEGGVDLLVEVSHGYEELPLPHLQLLSRNLLQPERLVIRHLMHKHIVPAVFSREEKVKNRSVSSAKKKGGKIFQ